MSENSGLSLRTIQRIENGETEPRGDSLKRLAMTFGVSPDEIIDWQTFEDRNVLNLLNLSQLGFLAFPILGIVIPLAIWILKKDKVKNVDRIGKSILNFQITWTIVFFLTYLVWILNTILHLGLPLSVFGPVVIIATLYIFNILMIIINSVRCYKVKETYYQPALRILR
ncbi:MAG: DNA-binding protein [Bacteroidetes bacterium GWF2_42_66]|nr:MAG: DNA-binding protein [Bacteroidetes bacterium GWA2_42_15]OFY02296.1 MAG: DNA-binding protein [Bacteroidetes bacterium GWE2_42_39]OFY41608.1 MAG: DNA-binding protein [Bacteroidetes bacterium GWF2_42_66]